MSILPDAIEEARRIVAASEAQALTLRLLGGLAVRLHSPSATHRSLARPYPDLDFALAEPRGDRVEAMLPDLGYAPNKSFNLLNGNFRLLFYDEERQRQVDVFVGGFKMCHRIPFLAERFRLDTPTLPPTELLLTKMQIVQMNEKDMRDLCALLLDHPFGEGDADEFNLAYLAGLCADDWGLWKTLIVSAGKVRDFCDAYDLEPEQKLTIVERLGVMRTALEGAPKTLKWKLRDKVGERLQWYDLPEEVQRG